MAGYTVTDACNNTATRTIEITSCDILISNNVIEPCMGGANGSIDLVMGAGGPPLLANSYEWSNGETTQDISNLTGGTYTVTITSYPITGGSCIVVHHVELAEKPSDYELTANIVDGCLGGVGGSIDLTITGGTGPYTYEWSNGETTEDISDLPFGNYVVNVYDDQGCSNFGFYVVDVRQIEVDAELNNQCNTSEKDGSITLTLNDSQQLGPYSFQWSGGETTQNISGQGAGDYSVTITDGDGCSDTYSYTLELENVNPLDLTNPFYTQYATITCSSGSNGSIAFNPFPTFPEYPESTPVWINSNGDIVGYGSGITNLAPGEYCVSIYPSVDSEGEGEGCPLAEGCFTVDGSGLVAGIDYVTNPERCEEYYYGGISVFASSSSSSLTISAWGPNFNLTNLPFSSPTMYWSNLEIGDYLFVVTDAAGCRVEFRATICCCRWDQQSDGNAPENYCYYPNWGLPDLEVSLDEIIQIEPDIGINTGSIDISTNLPTPPITYYSWTGPGGFISFDQDISNLTVGEYCVTASAGCETLTKCWLIENCTTLPWDVTDGSTDDCPGANAGIIEVSNVSVEFSSGEVTTGPFLFTLRDGDNNFIADYYQADAKFEGLNTGNYTVTIEVLINADVPDDRCETIRAYVIEEREPNINFDVDIEDTCPDYNYGSILITELQSDDPGFAYNWAGGGNGSEINGLYMGDDYQVTITDGRGCTVVAGPYEVGETSVLTPEEYQEFRPDCLVDYYCNDEIVFEAQEDLMATEGYVEGDCRYYEYWCEVDGQYYYPFGEDGPGREDRGYDEDLDLVNCTLTRTCKDGTPHDVIEGDSSTEHYSGCDGGTSSDCCYCFEAYTCIIMVDGYVHTEHIDITNHLSVTESPDIGSNPCDPDPEPPATTNCCDLNSPSVLNCEATVHCVGEDGTSSVLQNPVCVADCSVSAHNFICTQQEMEDVVNDFIGLPDTRESAKENVVINTVDKNLSVKVYPNPFQNSLFIEIDSDMNMILNAKIIDVLGRVVKKLDISIAKGKSVTNLQDLVIQNAGMYHLILSDNEGKILKTIPIIKQ